MVRMVKYNHLTIDKILPIVYHLFFQIGEFFMFSIVVEKSFDPTTFSPELVIRIPLELMQDNCAKLSSEDLNDFKIKLVDGILAKLN
jgi:hypothetical protein